MKLAILLLKKYIVWKEEILNLFFVGDSSLFIGLGNGYPLDNFPLFHGVWSVQFDNRYSGYLFMSKLPWSRPKCCLDEKWFIGQYTLSRGFSGRHEGSLPCELRATYLLFGRHPWTSKELAIF